ncbi:hypothetical protein HanPI659440_Chr08g0278721 [Helianthus annuus]|nr:hypothetical protein HanPI659440_Chr08g0278721 [Helianthus annuus]
MLIYLFTNLFSSSKETTQETLSFSFSIHASSPAPPPHGADLPPPPPHGADIPSSSTSRRAPPSRAPQSRPPSSAPAPPPHAAVFPAPPPHAAVLHHKEMGEKQQWSNDHLKWTPIIMTHKMMLALLSLLPSLLKSPLLSLLPSPLLSLIQTKGPKPQNHLLTMMI